MAQGVRDYTLHSRDEVFIRLNIGSSWQLYWRPKDLLDQFEYDLQKLFQRAGLRGTFEAKRVGQLVPGNDREGITLGEPKPFVLEFYAAYGDNIKKDVWQVTFSQKDTTTLHDQFTRALAGEVILPSPVVSKPAVEETPDESAEQGSADSDQPTDKSPAKDRPKSRACEPVAKAYFLTYLYSEASNGGMVNKSALTDIVADYYQFDDRRMPNFVHRNLVTNNLLKRSEVTDRLYEITPGAHAFAREHLEALLVLPAFQAKRAELEKLSADRLYQSTTQHAKRALKRIRAFLAITE